MADAHSSFSRYRCCGDALAVATLIPTPAGWSTIGELQEGDQVFDERGQPCQVVAATPVTGDRECFAVVFSDGQRIVADAAHRWLTSEYAARKAAAKRADARVRARLVTTQHIAATLRARGGQPNHAIPTCEPLQYPAARLLVDSYVLGVWLANNSASSDAGLTALDDEILERVRAAGYNVTVTPATGDESASGVRIEGLQDRLRILGLSEADQIPAEYLRASVKQRLQLLRGFMDIDGSIAPATGNCELRVTGTHLTTDVRELLHGLGVKILWTTELPGLNGRRTNERHQITFSARFPAFWLTRKLAKQPLDQSQPQRYIIDVQAIPSTPVRCIAADSPSHLYLATTACISTHNTEHSANRAPTIRSEDDEPCPA